MGLIYTENAALIKDYPEETTLKWGKALIIPGQEVVEVNCAAMAEDEVAKLLLKLDMLAHEANNDAIAKIMVSEADSILTMVRAVKKEVGGAARFAGIQGAGSNLDIMWLRTEQIGGLLLNKAAVAACGIYGQANGTIPWYYATFTAGTAINLIPSQQMDDYVGLIHIGAIDPVVNPIMDACTFTLSGRTCPAQYLPWNVRKAFNEQAMPVVKFELPVLILPKVTQTLAVHPTVTNGDCKMQLLSILCAKAESLTL